MIMDSGVFEPVNRVSTRFEDSSLKVYKLVGASEASSFKKVEKPESNEVKKPMSRANNLNQGKVVDLCDDDDNYHKKSTTTPVSFGKNKENTQPSRMVATKILYHGGEIDKNNNTHRYNNNKSKILEF
jgi:hypothetical protein